MKVLITGAAGQLGKDLALTCGAAGDDVTALTSGQLDVSDAEAVRQVVGSLRPDVVYSAAAWTAVDDCESDPDKADRINHLAVRYLRQATADAGAHLVPVSTDYVFDGTKTDPYVETDPTNPQSVYGKSKRSGEIAAGDQATVVRTSWVSSVHGGNMVATILRLASSHPELSFVDDQRGNPTFTADLAPALRQLAADREQGMFHITNTGTATWFEFAQEVLRAGGHDPARVPYHQYPHRPCLAWRCAQQTPPWPTTATYRLAATRCATTRSLSPMSWRPTPNSVE